ncbi:hypothetical protein NKH93_23220 [Mesorhizobium sp. M0954]|uniref:hypothetical protein n=1 Tax=Mesorhizobium sp. M0954 TaxID=2957032 RepID=UPI00333AC934
MDKAGLIVPRQAANIGIPAGKNRGNCRHSKRSVIRTPAPDVAADGINLSPIKKMIMKNKRLDGYHLLNEI